jgi:NAD(P)-dependent dehydrogenase (short-subunit alcohol dehydrogenase family)
MNPAALLDKLLEASVVPSFTRIGYEARRRAEDWTSLDDYDLSDQVIVITGGTSGLGRAAASQVARNGATLIVVGRTESKNAAVAAELVSETGNDQISHVAADMGDYDQVRALAAHLLDNHDRLDVLMHNAGALSDTRREAPDGTEATVASQVVGPFLLTQLLLERLTQSVPARVITMSSGGMYSAPLTVSQLQMSAADYKGTEQYARAKRAQVTLNEMWAERHGASGVTFHCVHPGWADTPGVADALPGFKTIVGPLLRSPEAGADTMVWLAADDEPLETNGLFWHDRRPRSTHKLPITRRADTAERRSRLWDHVAGLAGL